MKNEFNNKYLVINLYKSVEMFKSYEHLEVLEEILE